ncbi:hypothetical protein GCM10010140_29070 [Streptosporangium pseudovulgare]|uniref:Uncharacterized protein n=1 Tax=Streptosporangium pseudovulgare TaxID=35765 RepID=A0ABQ2QTT4_9ACTN|nr:hypothetical protein GCM10010140_29070 [Streptosporangium pseudovulgare]
MPLIGAANTTPLLMEVAALNDREDQGPLAVHIQPVAGRTETGPGRPVRAVRGRGQERPGWPRARRVRLSPASATAVLTTDTWL